jgi:hypothetical protein
VLPHRTIAGHRGRDDRSRNERREPSHESRLARAHPRHDPRGSPQIVRAAGGPFALRAGRHGREQRVEPETLEVERSVDDAQDLEEAADPRLRRDGERIVRSLAPQDAERGNGQEYVAQRAGMDRERQGRSSANAASWRRPFVASAELE